MRNNLYRRNNKKSNRKKSDKNNKNDLKNRIINRQTIEIDRLKNAISKLEIDCGKKDEIITSIETIREELTETLEVLRNKTSEYDGLISELLTMRNVLNQKVFKGKWRIVRFLINK